MRVVALSQTLQASSGFDGIVMVPVGTQLGYCRATTDSTKDLTGVHGQPDFLPPLCSHDSRTAEKSDKGDFSTLGESRWNSSDPCARAPSSSQREEGEKAVRHCGSPGQGRAAEKAKSSLVVTRLSERLASTPTLAHR